MGDGPLDQHLQLPPRAPKPTFTMKKLTALPDLRNAIRAWHQEFSDEGPYDEDVQALVKYLRDVVVEERDMDKAVSLVKWLAWVIDDSDDYDNDGVKIAWVEALGNIQGAVQDAVLERGLGRVDFG